MPDIMKIGSRESPLALWQARLVQDQLSAIGLKSEIVTVKSQGDSDLHTPLYAMGIQGIFTRALDIALLRNEIDLAVHSLKDVPTVLPQGIRLGAVLARGNPHDALIYKDTIPAIDRPYRVATSSLRRASQWLHRFPNHQTPPLRGNVQSRLQKLLDHDHWQGALFAAAGVERANLEVPHLQLLDWMIPTPGQGAIAVALRTGEEKLTEALSLLNHPATELTTGVERSFLRRLMGGCTMPIGGFAELQHDKLIFRGCVLTLDGTRMAEVQLSGPADRPAALAEEAVLTLLDRGGAQIVATFKQNL